MHKIVKILGSGFSQVLYKYKEGDTVWCPLSMYCEEAKVDKWFGMHDFETGTNVDNLVDQTNYPIKEISEKFQSLYFTNTVSYMIALALYEGVEEINLYGVDMSGEDEYYSQRGSVMYWVGFARAMGVKVTLASETDKPALLYGYEKSKNLIKKLETMKQWAETEKANIEDSNTKQQYIGFIHAIDLVKKEL